MESESSDPRALTPTSRIIAAVTGWSLAGASTAFFAAGACTDCIDVARRRSDFWWFAAWLALVYSATFAAAGLIAAGLEQARRMRRRAEPRQEHGFSSTVAAHLMGGLLAAAASSLLMDGARTLANDRGASWARGLTLASLGLAAAVVAIALPRLLDLCSRHTRAASAFASLVPAVATLGLGASSLRAPRAAAVADALVSPAESDGPVLVFGIDGADWRRINPLLDQGRLPHLARLIARGVRAPLATTLPSMSPILWNSVATGTDSATHGVEGFTELRFPGLPCGVQRLPRWGLLRELTSIGTRNDRFQIPVTACRRRVKPMWSVLGEQGRRVAVINWYATWPAAPLNGYLISDRNPRRAASYLRRAGAHLPREAGVLFPDALWPLVARTDVPDLAHEEVLDLPLLRDLDPAAKAEVARNRRLTETLGLIYLSDRFTAEIGLAILEREPIDFVAVYLAGVDHWGHRIGRFREVIDRYYELVDDILGRYVAALPSQATIFVLSDHGWDDDGGDQGDDHAPSGRLLGGGGHPRGPQGILVAAGPPIAAGASLDAQPALVDIAPTILALHGLPASQEMSGRVLGEILTPAARERAPSRRIWSYGAPADSQSSRGAIELVGDEDTETLKKLRALGYVE